MARIKPHRNPTNRSRRRLRRPVPTPAGGSTRARAARSARAGRMIVPSTLTILAICAGLTAVRSADSGQVDLAMGLLVLAAVFDGLDGRVARMMDATTKIGAEVDSLADAINFGVAPALIVYSVVLRDNPSSGAQDFGWVLALLYCTAIVLRLARFNTLLDDDSAPKYTKDYFVGVPAPAAAVMALLPIGLQQHFGEGWWSSVPAVGAWLLFIGFLAVSRIPTLALKSASIRPSALAGLLFVVAAAAALLFTFPYLLMVIAVAAYLIHIPFAWRTQRWAAAHPEHWDAPARDRRLQRRDERRQAVADGTRRRVMPSRSVARLGLRRPQAPRED
ncbi:CDP-alcohol phosphatidyltransferase family protein [Gordonia neofelifaecis]|uniref:CDP-diacylglycerol--serineO-phosphatidyltransfer ase n=1 Tax=Gordonia neofelifaecis NRRL B-59395 TaxID=644548 RepID=F1YNB5_9ACTN|nr:phosphatidylcholine/phosphatidylserine synthase [Gordonia neofelifaecis]EGD53826.1 CDP-diacylglycerol--serineO-phosphatidyltransfer ase [Gordonia neofelifaecis NRRL B-59395]